LDVDGNDELAFANEYEFVKITLISPKDFEYTSKLSEADKKSAKPIEKSLVSTKIILPTKGAWWQQAGWMVPENLQSYLIDSYGQD